MKVGAVDDQMGDATAARLQHRADGGGGRPGLGPVSASLVRGGRQRVPTAQHAQLFEQSRRVRERVPPAPAGSGSSLRSNSATSTPWRAKARAAVNPAMPPPAIRTGSRDDMTAGAPGLGSSNSGKRGTRFSVRIPEKQWLRAGERMKKALNRSRRTSGDAAASGDGRPA